MRSVRYCYMNALDRPNCSNRCRMFSFLFTAYEPFFGMGLHSSDFLSDRIVPRAGMHHLSTGYRRPWAIARQALAVDTMAKNSQKNLHIGKDGFQAIVDVHHFGPSEIEVWRIFPSPSILLQFLLFNSGEDRRPHGYYRGKARGERWWPRLRSTSFRSQVHLARRIWHEHRSLVIVLRRGKSW